MNRYPELEDVIKILGLEPLDGEGGMWVQGHVSDEILKEHSLNQSGEGTGMKGTIPARCEGDRPLYGTIYYLLTSDSFSCMHRLDSDEVWYHHFGPAASLLLIDPEGKAEIARLGSDLLNGERPQITVPRGTWQGCCIAGSEASSDVYTLMSTSMAPAYMAEGFERGSFGELSKSISSGGSEEVMELLRYLTSEPVYI